MLESANVLPLAPLSRYRQRVYQEGMEDAIADLVAIEIGRVAEILTVVESHRARIYR